MQTVLNQMLNKYSINNSDEQKNAIKEIVQEVALCGLSRAGFFNSVAFYGGTALRIFHGLDRFSEDLDFSLTAPDPNFELNKYLSTLENNINSLGLKFTVEEKKKSVDSDIKSAFLKGNTKEHILSFGIDGIEKIKDINPHEVIKIKLEVDVNPPPYATFENKHGLLPYPYQIKIYDRPSLFAGKIHAVICRAWGNRTKGRDLYDYLFYLSQNAEVNMPHLSARLAESCIIEKNSPLSYGELLNLLEKRFAEIDFEQAKSDVLPFIKDKSKLELWNCEFFCDVTKNLKIKE